MHHIWRFIPIEEHQGSFNMAFDEQLARALLDGSGLPTLRLFRWKPWAISLGFNQEMGQIDVERARADGIDVVRRPTGGRAVLHAEELTYSVTMEATGKSVLAVYNAISTALVTGLRRFGVDVSLSKVQPDLRAHYSSLSSIPCFTASARYEIESRGRKLVGSAQRRYRSSAHGREVVLQHGSLLIGPAHKRLATYLLLPDESARGQLIKELDEKTVELQSLTHRPIDLHEVAACIRQGFEEAWGIAFTEVSSLEERRMVYG